MLYIPLKESTKLQFILKLTKFFSFQYVRELKYVLHEMSTTL